MSGGLELSDFKLKTLRPDIYSLGGSIKQMFSKFGSGFTPRDMIATILQHGDSQPAIVISMRPLLVSAYSDEFDGVVILDIPEPLKESYKLQLGTRLLTCCFYGQDDKVQGDIITGAGFSKRWQLFMPVLADLCSGDYPRIRQLKQKIDENNWHKAWYMGLAYRRQKPGWVRFGIPGLSMVEATSPASSADAMKSIYDRA